MQKIHIGALFRRRIAIVVSALLLAMTPQVASAQTKIKIGSSVKSIFSLPLYVAEANGYYKEEGLDVETIFFSGGPAATAALIGGSVQFISSAFENTLKLAQRGQPVINVMTMQADFSGALVVHKRIAQKLGRPVKIEDMKGLRIGTLQRGGFADSAIRYMLIDAGIDPDKDVSLIPVRGFDKHIASAAAGEIDASLMVEPWQTIAVYEVGDWDMITNITLGEGPAVFHDIGYCTLQVTPAYLAANRPVVEKVVRALAKAQVFIRDRANLERTVAIAQAVFGEIKPETLHRSIEAQLATFRPAVKQDMIDKTMDLLLKNGQITGAAPDLKTISDVSFQEYWK
ncbi:ABC transporter substrate-binding protein [Xanthobacter pseudotagetidis]|uniref:ABC transporter substrate-binding protein n=1 Tax=Xanthobacter pseudotagetidis TaxID=3119911 RepID=UPI003729117C